MFPRLPLIYRLIAVCISLTFIMVLFNLPTHRIHRRPSWIDDVIVSEIRNQRDGVEVYHVDETKGDSGNDLVKEAAEEADRTVTYTPESTITTTAEPGPIVNPHDFKYLINPSNLCNTDNLKILIYVHSAPKNCKKRQMIRDTWGAKAIQMTYNMRLVFIMGRVNNSNTMDLVTLESNRYGDIVVEDFYDSYRNLTYKGIAALRWASTYCDDVTYVFKTDDDILVDIDAVMQYMNSSTFQNYGTNNLIVCNQWTRMKVIRDEKSKWYISKKEYPDNFFSPYCSGSAFIMSIDVVKRMYDVSFYTPFFWVDDFYITGMLTKKLNLQHKPLNEAYVLSSKSAVEKMKRDFKRQLKFFHVNNLTNIYKMWSMLKQRTNVTCGDCFTKTPSTGGKPRS